MQEAMRRLCGGLLVLGIVGVFGCGKQPVAIVGQHRITRQEFLDRLEKTAGRSVLMQMIQERLIEDAFAASGLTLTPEEVQKRIEEIKKRFPSPEVFAQALAAQGMTEQDLLERYTLELKLTKLATKDVKVTEQELRKFFQEQRTRFDRPAMISYSEIVVENEAQAKKVMQELSKPGTDFGNLARQYSISLTRSTGGKMANLTEAQIQPPAILTALRKAREGQVTGPVEVDARWYILRLDGKTPGKKADFKRDRAEIEEAYKSLRAKQAGELLQELQEKATINVVDPKYADLNELLRPKPALPQFGPRGSASGGQTPSGSADGAQSPGQPVGRGSGQAAPQRQSAGR